MKKISMLIILCAVFLMLLAPFAAVAVPDHSYSVNYLNSGMVYEKHKGIFEAKDAFRSDNLTFRNTLNFSYAENSDKAVTDNISRINELFTVSSDNFRFSAIMNAAFFSGSDFLNNFQYAAVIERTKKLESGSLDYGIAVTNFVVYNRVYPGPIIFPIISWTTNFSPSTICRVGLPTLIMHKGPKYSAGFTYAPVFNSKLFFGWMSASFYNIELSAYSYKSRLALDDPTIETKVLHMFYMGVFLENSFYIGKHVSFTLGGGCNILERTWRGHQIAINRGSEQGASYRLKAGFLAMF